MSQLTDIHYMLNIRQVPRGADTNQVPKLRLPRLLRCNVSGKFSKYINWHLYKYQRIYDRYFQGQESLCATHRKEKLVETRKPQTGVSRA